jgi:hypothetical protein
MPHLQLNSIHCRETEDSGNDEAYITVNDVVRWGPVEIDEGEIASSMDLSAVGPIFFSTSALIKLFDDDGGFLGGDDDLLGTHTAFSSELGLGEQRAYFNSDGADYTVTYTVIA